MNNNQELIRALVDDLQPVRRLAPANQRMRSWVASALSSALLALVWLGARRDWAARLHDVGFLLEGALLLGTFVLAAHTTFALSVPGRAARHAGTLSWLVASSWLVLVVIRLFAAPSAGLMGSVCVARLLALSLVPGLTLFVMLRRAAPLQRARTALIATLALGSLAMLGTQLLCAKDAPSHLLVWHLSPVLVAMGAAFWSARR
jgi:hypothetical protein